MRFHVGVSFQVISVDLPQTKALSDVPVQLIVVLD